MSQADAIDRLSYGIISDATDMPNLLEVQLNSYNNFLQPDAEPSKRENKFFTSYPK